MSIELNAVPAADFSAGGSAPKGAESTADGVDFLNALLGALRVDPRSSEESPTVGDASESAHEASLPEAGAEVEGLASKDATGLLQEAPASIGAVQAQERPSAIDPVDRSLERVAPELRERVERVIERMRDEFGHQVAVVEGYRTSSRQDHLYAQGRSAPGRITTWTRRSWHTDGLAADLQVDGSYENNLAYARLQRVAREEGLRTLGPMDRGHVELPDSRFAVQPDAAPGPTRRFVGVATPAAPAAVAAVAAVATPGSWIEIPAALPDTPAAIPAPVPIPSPEIGTNVPGQSGIGASRGGSLPAQLPGAALDALSRAQSVDLVGVTQTSSKGGVAAHAVPTPAPPLGAQRLAHTPTEAAAPRSGQKPADAGGMGQSQPSTVGALDGAASMWAGAGADPDRKSGTDGGGRRGGATKEPDARAVAGVASAADEIGGAAASSGSAAASPTGPVAPAVGSTAGPSPLDRVERIEELRELARSAQPGRVAIRLGGAGSDQVRVGLLNRAVDADLDISNPESAARIRGRVAELHRALEGRALELGSMTVSGVNATQTGAGGWPGAATDGSADVLRALFASDRGDRGGDGQGREGTTHEQRPDRGGQDRRHRGKPEEELN